MKNSDLSTVNTAKKDFAKVAQLTFSLLQGSELPFTLAGLFVLLFPLLCAGGAYLAILVRRRHAVEAMRNSKETAKLSVQVLGFTSRPGLNFQSHTRCANSLPSMHTDFTIWGLANMTTLT